MEALSDAVMKVRDAVSQFVHTTGSTYMQCCCLCTPYSNNSLLLAKHHLLTIPERERDYGMSVARGAEGSVCKLPVVGCTDTLRTNKTFRKSIFIQER